MIHDDTETAKLSEIISDLKCDSANDRDYLENTTIPAVTVALKNLLIEMKKKDLPLNATYFASKYSSEIQKDQPFEKFDAINWLAQYLMRNNPSHVGHHTLKYMSESVSEEKELKMNQENIGEPLYLG